MLKKIEAQARKWFPYKKKTRRSSLICLNALELEAKFGDYPYPAGIYLLKVNNRNTRTRCEICSKLTIKTPE